MLAEGSVLISRLIPFGDALPMGMCSPQFLLPSLGLREPAPRTACRMLTSWDSHPSVDAFTLQRADL